MKPLQINPTYRRSSFHPSSCRCSNSLSEEKPLCSLGFQKPPKRDGEPFDINLSYLQRKIFLQNHNPRRVENSLEESVRLAKKIVYLWDEVSFKVWQVYKQFGD